MNINKLLLSAVAASVACGVHFSTSGADPKNPPPPVYVGQTPPPPAAVPAPTPVAAPPPSAPAQSSAAKLEKLAMPIALHPDPLIAIILPASAYPLEIVQAARFVRDTNNFAKVDEQSWDDNVKAVAKFPDLIAKMDADLPWTMELGQAFVEQPKELMDTIQALRAKAQKAGTLKSSPQQVVTVTNVVVLHTNVTQVVTVTNQIVQVQPSNPSVVYVPTYPTTVYAPPPAYDPWAPLVTFGVGMAMGAIIANNCDWHGGGVWCGGSYHGDVDIDINNDINIDRGDRPDRPNQASGNRAGATGAKGTQQKWQPNQSRMKASGSPATAQSREARGWGGGSTQASQRPAGGGGARPSQTPSGGGARPSAQPSVSGGQRASSTPRSSTWQQPSGNAGNSGNRASSSSFDRSSSSQRSSAFSGVNSGGTRDSSSRGASSRGGGGGFRGGGGGRGGGGRR